jgi:hypothetical protein
MPAPDPAEATIISHAQEFVHNWLRNANRRPFREAIRVAERKLWSPLPDSQLQREAFRKVANAIRVGYGHAHTNPTPLLEIVRAVLTQSRHRVMSDSRVENQ